MKLRLGDHTMLLEFPFDSVANLDEIKIGLYVSFCLFRLLLTFER